MSLGLPPELLSQGLIKPLAKPVPTSSQPTKVAENLDAIRVVAPDESYSDPTPRMSAKDIVSQSGLTIMESPSTPPISASKPKEDEPIVLQYKFTGTQGGVTLDTIMLEIDGRAFAVAYNPVTHTHVKTLEVVPMEKQPFQPDIAKKQVLEKIKKGVR